MNSKRLPLEEVLCNSSVILGGGAVHQIGRYQHLSSMVLKTGWIFEVLKRLVSV